MEFPSEKLSQWFCKRNKSVCLILGLSTTPVTQNSPKHVNHPLTSPIERTTSFGACSKAIVRPNRSCLPNSIHSKPSAPNHLPSDWCVILSIYNAIYKFMHTKAQTFKFTLPVNLHLNPQSNPYVRTFCDWPYYICETLICPKIAPDSDAPTMPWLRMCIYSFASISRLASLRNYIKQGWQQTYTIPEARQGGIGVDSNTASSSHMSINVHTTRHTFGCSWNVVSSIRILLLCCHSRQGMGLRLSRTAFFISAHIYIHIGNLRAPRENRIPTLCETRLPLGPKRTTKNWNIQKLPMMLYWRP